MPAQTKTITVSTAGTFFVMGGVLVDMAVTVHDGMMILLYPKSQKTQQLVTSDPKICLMTGGGLKQRDDLVMSL